MTMNDEKKNKSTIIRRSKKHGRAFNKELRQSVHELSVNLSDLNIDASQNVPTRPANGLKRTRSFYREDHVQVSAQSSREILKQYVVSLKDHENESTDDSDTRSENDNDTLEIKIHNNNSNNNNIDDNKEDTETDHKNNYSGENPIFDFIEENNLKELTVYLLKHDKINLEARNSDGQTPLIFSLCMGHSDIAKLLIQSGADVTAKDNFDVTALRYAVEDGDFEIASLLISKGANAASVQNGF